MSVERKTITERLRKGDTLITTTVTIEADDALIRFEDILAVAEVVPDNLSHEAPWESCDGYEHKLIHLDYCEEGRYNPDHVIHDGCRRRLIHISKEQVVRWGAYAYVGASKQVQAEARAENLRRTYDQLVRWYKHGWEWWGVVCEFKDEEESLWGIDDYDYADKSVREDMAYQAARALERNGYTVTGIPDYRSRPEKQERLRERFARQLGFPDKRTYLNWLHEKGE